MDAKRIKFKIKKENRIDMEAAINEGIKAAKEQEYTKSYDIAFCITYELQCAGFDIKPTKARKEMVQYRIDRMIKEEAEA